MVEKYAITSIQAPLGETFRIVFDVFFSTKYKAPPGANMIQFNPEFTLFNKSRVLMNFRYSALILCIERSKKVFSKYICFKLYSS